MKTKEKLKTLRTLKDLSHKYRMLDGDFEWIMLKELKTEAIKWVKYLENDEWEANQEDIL